VSSLRLGKWTKLVANTGTEREIRSRHGSLIVKKGDVRNGFREKRGRVIVDIF